MKVSVVIPCHNAERYLAQTLGAVLDQHRGPDEVLVVDDGSTDASLDIARTFEQTVGVVHVLSHRSGSASRTRHVGAMQSTGDALLFLDADDVLAPETIEALCDALPLQAAGVALCPWYRLEWRDDAWVERPATCRPRDPRRDDLSNWLLGWYHPPCSVLWSRGAYQRSGGWDPDWSVNDDGHLMMRALIYGAPLACAQRGAAYYRRLPEGEISLSGRRLSEAGLASRVRTLEKIAWLLAERDALEGRREAVGAAFRQVAADAAADHAELARKALGLARRYGPSWPRRAFRRALRVSGRLVEHVGPTAVARRERPRAAPPSRVEIRFGLERAEAVTVGREGVFSVRRPWRPATLPTVSVVIPVYNRAALLSRSIGSVLAQTCADYEVLVVDDASTDDIASVVKGFGDERLRHLRQPYNGGAGAARNRGLREARGQFIAFLDSDDEWMPDKLALQLDRFAALPEQVGLLYTGVESVFADGATCVERPVARGDVYTALLLRNLIHGGGSNAMIRRAVVATIGFFDDALPAIEDYDYWLRVARFFHIDFVDRVLIRYHEPRDIARRSLNVEDDLDARSRFYLKWVAEMRRTGLAHRFLLDRARKHAAPPIADRRAARRLALQAFFTSPRPSTLRLLVRYVCLPRDIPPACG